LDREAKAARKRSEAARKRAEEEAARIIKRNAANQERFLQQEIQNAQRRASILDKLSIQLENAVLQNLEEGEAKQIAIEKKTSEQRINNLKAQGKAFEDQQQEQVEKAIGLFGVFSKEVEDLEKQTGEERERIRGQVNALITQETTASQTRQQDIREEFAAQEIAALKKKNEEEKKLIEQNKQDVLDAEQEKRDATLKTINDALNTTTQILGAIDSIAQASSDKRIARVEEDEAERAANIESLQSSLQSASGLEAAFLQQQISQEEKAAEQLAAKKARIEKDAAINAKALAITQAIVNTALAVTAQLSVPGAGFVLAGIAAALGAVEIATIAAAPLAKGGLIDETFARGGMVNGPSHANGGVKFGVGGQVKELEGGEAVINKRSTSMFRNELSSMNVAGGGVPFANGGVVSPPLGSPALSSLSTQNDNSIALIQSNQATIKELQNSLMRMEVVYTTNTGDAIQADKTDRKEIQTRATI
jgi:hypothetical protein